VPFRVFRRCCSPLHVAAKPASSFGIGRSFRVFAPSQVRRVWLRRAALCRWPLPRLCGFSAAESPDVLFRCPGGSSLRVSPFSRVLPNVSWPPAAAGRQLSWAFVPFSTRRTGRSTGRRRCHPPATFRPQGLVTLSTVYALHVRAGSVSRRRRSWDFTLRSIFLHERCSWRFRPNEPACRFAGWFIRRRSVGPAHLAAASGFLPFESPLATGAGLVRRPLAAPLGFYPFRVLLAGCLNPLKADDLSRAFATCSGSACAGRERAAGAPESAQLLPGPSPQPHEAFAG